MARGDRDLNELEELLRSLPQRQPALADFFAAAADEVVLTRAPGRLDVMGGIADYSGSLVLELPLADAACVAAARTHDDDVRVASLGTTTREARFSAKELMAACGSFESARAYFAAQPPDVRWTGYVLGGLVELFSRGACLEGGLRVLVLSAVPEGAGVSSSAAIEVAALSALVELWQVSLAGVALGLACQRVENFVVGAPCGAMDQLTSACGEEGRLLALSCQPAKLLGAVALPEGLSVFGVDSGVRHSVTGEAYRHVRVAAFMGLRILAEQLGAHVRPLGDGRVALERDPLGGYLANLTRAALTTELRAALPESLSGAEFLARFQGISDDATRVEPHACYCIRAATLHPIEEHARAEHFARDLPTASTADSARLGLAMYESHASYSACGLGSVATDRLVAAVRALGPEAGFYGAKITGGGSGGTVSVLARTEQLPRLRELSQVYSSESGWRARLFVGSSAGALGFPARRLSLS